MPNNIMVVDDEQDTLDAVKTVLEKKGFAVDTALSREECLSKMTKGGKIDLILLDIMMPGMSPGELIQKLRKLNIKTKIIYLTAIKMLSEPDIEKKSKGWVADFSEEYVVDYVEKPFDNFDLVDRINNALGY